HRPPADDLPPADEPRLLDPASRATIHARVAASQADGCAVAARSPFRCWPATLVHPPAQFDGKAVGLGQNPLGKREYLAKCAPRHPPSDAASSTTTIVPDGSNSVRVCTCPDGHQIVALTGWLRAGIPKCTRSSLCD